MVFFSHLNFTDFKCDKCDMEFDDSLMLCNHRCIVDAKMKREFGSHPYTHRL